MDANLIASLIKELITQNPPEKTELTGSSDQQLTRPSFMEVGKNYLLRTITMYVVGKLEAINDQEFLFTSASWVADVGRFHDALKTGSLSEVEPFIKPAIVSRDSLVDATEWTFDLPTEQK